MWWDRERPWVVLVPPVTAGGMMLLFFWLTNRWTNLENPVASQIALFAALSGVAAGIAATRITNWLLVCIPGGLTAIALIWAYAAPNATAEDSEFRQTLWVLTLLLAITTVAVNLPQIVRGRRLARDQRAVGAADAI